MELEHDCDFLFVSGLVGEDGSDDSLDVHDQVR